MLKIKENHETFQNYGLCLLKTDRQTNQTTYRLDLYMPYESSQKIQLSLFNSSRENHVSPMLFLTHRQIQLYSSFAIKQG